MKKKSNSMQNADFSGETSVEKVGKTPVLFHKYFDIIQTGMSIKDLQALGEDLGLFSNIGKKIVKIS